MSERLKGKVVVITGTGGPGMGRTAALRFASEGAKIVGCDLNEAGAKETARLVKEAGGTMFSLEPLDLSKDDAAESLMATADREFGGIDILYNNASWIKPGHPLKISTEDMHYGLDGTVVSTWRAIKAAVPYMNKRGGGSIINVSSSTGHPVGTGTLDNFNLFFAYAIGKAAVLHLTRLMAIELSAMNIRVNCVSPGAILPNAAPMLGDPGSKLDHEWKLSFLVKRAGVAEDVVNAALFLASSESAYITGQDMLIDGGMLTSGFQGPPLQRKIFDAALVAAASGSEGEILQYAKS